MSKLPLYPFVSSGIINSKTWPKDHTTQELSGAMLNRTTSWSTLTITYGSLISGGGYTHGWVDEDEVETFQGNLQALSRIFDFLLGETRNTEDLLESSFFF